MHIMTRYWYTLHLVCGVRMHYIFALKIFFSLLKFLGEKKMISDDDANVV